MRLRLCGVAAPVLACTLMMSGVAFSAPAPTPLRNAQITGYQLVQRFMNDLQAGDSAKLQTLLSPAFVVQRASGTWATRKQYLAVLPVVRTFAITTLHAEYAPGVLVVRWEVQTSETVGGQLLGLAPAPRLSTFVWSGTRWRMASHANFNPTA